MSADRVVYSMIVGWVVLIGVLIVLDWLGNPNRGSFRPKGDRQIRDRGVRKVDRARRRLEDDAAVRATLRDAYGASSMRLSWSPDKESQARALDDALVVQDLGERSAVVEVGSRDVTTIDYTVVAGDPLPNPDETPPEPGDPDGDDQPPEPEASTDPAPEASTDTEPEASADPEPEASADPEPEASTDPAPEASTDPAPAADDDSPPDDDASDAPRPRGWRVGVDPLALTSKGSEPSPVTVRQRVWKNLGTAAGWDETNLERLREGRPPRRRNPITGKDERAVVDVETGTASWGSEPVDPFADDREEST